MLKGYFRTLSGVKIVDMDSLKLAITTLHEEYRVPHILITSVSLPSPGVEPYLHIVGSTHTSTFTPRIFGVKIPAIDCFFSGTGDMFAALIVVRLREAVYHAEGLIRKDAWVSGDEVGATELPLAKATEKVLASMHQVLVRTKERRDEEWERYQTSVLGSGKGEDEKRDRLMRSKVAEVRLVRNVGYLKRPEVKFKAEEV